MKSRLVIAFLFLSTAVCLSQEINSQGDKYFYAYAYEDAIKAYQKQMQQGGLMTDYQRLNLADSYFRTGEYNKAAKIYLESNKNDSIMSDNRFNTMLQSLAMTSEKERVKAFMKSKANRLTGELVENAEFNYLLLDADDTAPSGFSIFSFNGNGPQADIAPTFYKDGLLFSSSRKTKSKKIYGPSGESYFDIYEAAIGPSATASDVRPFERIPNSEFHKTTPYYSEGTGNTYYVLSNTEDKNLAFDEKGKNALSIGMVNENGTFSFLLKDLSTSFYYPFYDVNGERLYFSANFKDSYGGTDIYYVDTNNGQVMSQPINLGPRINSPGNEIAPYAFENSLYFSSDIFYGLGGMDIYRSNMLPDNGFSIPVNLGKGINTKYDEFGFIIKESSEEGLSGYFSSNRPGGKGSDDIYGFKVSEKPGLRTLIFKGKVVKPPYDELIADASVIVRNADGKVLKEAITGANGLYLIEIPYNAVVSMEVSKETYSTFKETYNAKGLQELEKAPLKIELSSVDDIVKEKEGKTVLNLKDFFFASGQSNLTLEITAELDKAVDVIQKFPKLKFSIETHTDSRGSRSSNQKVSQQRSDAIKAYLLQNGVPTENITGSIGFGEDRIINNCSDGVYCLDFLHKQNLRTLFVVENYDELAQ